MDALDEFLQTGTCKQADGIANATDALQELRESDAYTPPFSINNTANQAEVDQRGSSTEVRLRVVDSKSGEEQFVVNENGSTPHAVLVCFQKAFGDRLRGLTLERFRIEETERGVTVRVAIRNEDAVCYLGSHEGDHQLASTRAAISDCVEFHVVHAPVA